MLEVQELSRPETFTKIYIPDFDIPVLKEQIKKLNPKLGNQIDNGNVTITIREPTQSKLGAIFIEITAMEQRLDRALDTFNRLPQSLGKGGRNAAIAVDNGVLRLGMNIEEFEPSAFKKQIQFNADNLPA